MKYLVSRYELCWSFCLSSPILDVLISCSDFEKSLNIIINDDLPDAEVECDFIGFSADDCTFEYRAEGGVPMNDSRTGSGDSIIVALANPLLPTTFYTYTACSEVIGSVLRICVGGNFTTPNYSKWMKCSDYVLCSSVDMLVLCVLFGAEEMIETGNHYTLHYNVEKVFNLPCSYRKPEPVLNQKRKSDENIVHLFL